ncbi:hypothetical protein ACHAWF_012487 [Thalassiosira exigua]
MIVKLTEAALSFLAVVTWTAAAADVFDSTALAGSPGIETTNSTVDGGGGSKSTDNASKGDQDETVLDGLPGMGDAMPAIGSNIDGDGSVFANYIKLRNDGQFFVFLEGFNQYETPGLKVVSWRILQWCANLEFADIGVEDSSFVGYTANCVVALLGDSVQNLASAGSQFPSLTPDEFVGTVSLTATYVPQTNIIEIHDHSNTDSLSFHYWDDGRSTMPFIGWEVHDEGDDHPNAALTSFSAVGKLSWISAEEMGILLNSNSAEFTPKAFDDIYAKVWTAHAPHAEAIEGGTSTSIATISTADEGGTSNSTDNAATNEGTVDEDVDAVDVFNATMLNGIPGIGNAKPPIGSNIDGNFIFSNYIALRNTRQFFTLMEGSTQYEKPGSGAVSWRTLFWCANVEIMSDAMDSPVVGYTANCVMALLGDETKSSLTPEEFIDTFSLSAIYSPQTNIIKGRFHSNTDNFIYSFWDDGRSTMPCFGWEFHDEGHKHPDAATSSRSDTGKISWISAEEAGRLLNNDVADFSFEAFGDIYKEVWTAHAPHAPLGDETSTSADTTNNTNNGGEELNSTNNVEVNEAKADGDQYAVDSFDSTVLDHLPGMGNASPAIGLNVHGNSVFSNYIKLRNNGQFFILGEFTSQYEKPGTDAVILRLVHWCANIMFMDINLVESPVVGYTANCVFTIARNTLKNMTSAGAQMAHVNLDSDEFLGTRSLSAVYVPQTNIIEGNYHSNTDNLIIRFWDDGYSEMPCIGWEVHDEGDTHPNAATSSWSGGSKTSWISAEEMASFLNNEASDFTPEAFERIYKEVWAAHAPHVETLKDETTTDAETANSTGNEGVGSNLTSDATQNAGNANQDSDAASDKKDQSSNASGKSSGKGWELSVVAAGAFAALLVGFA